MSGEDTAEEEPGRRLVSGWQGRFYESVSQNATATLGYGHVRRHAPMVLKREDTDPSAEQPPGWPEGNGTQSGDSS